MKPRLPIAARARRLGRKCGPLLLVLQKTPLTQVAAHEARVLGSAGINQLTKWVVTAVAGLGSYDCVSGATQLKQLLPSSGSSSVPAQAGEVLTFVVSVTGAPSTAKSWRLSGNIPTGLTYKNGNNTSNQYTVAGKLTSPPGNYAVTVTAYEKASFGGGSRSAAFTIQVAPGVTPPVFTAQPTSVTIASNTTVTLSAGASGATGFQWYKGSKGDVTLPVGNGTAYTTTPLLVNTNYWVRATGAGGTADSDTATITVVNPPGITTQPGSVAINAGTATTLSVVASGPAPQYQWYAGPAGDESNPVSGANGASFTTPALATTSSYWVRVTNTVGSVDSDAATVAVINPPGITSQPLPATIESGGATTLSVVATGSTPGYQWYEGEAPDTSHPVSGANGPDFTTPALTTTTSYWVRVSNGAGQVDSATAVVTVNSVDTFTSWAASRFSEAQQGDPQISGAAADPDGDGVTNAEEYAYGTDPLTSGVALTPHITLEVDQLTCSFVATAATGAGYTGLTRHYALESSATLTGAWTAVSGLEDITAAGQTVTHSTTVSPDPVFYRIRVWLTGS